ncbi:M48 family metallopeptidase [Bremerella cremea]|uniref:M48 family metallopeptidase n=1 Tax=Bremerella cremea TaxID=1031537 RepID=UPI0031F036CB
MSQNFSSLGFVKTYIYPALALFLIPVACLFFYEHVQGTYDEFFRQGMRDEIKADRTLNPQERAEELAQIENVDLSSLLVSSEPELVAWRNGLPADYLYMQLSIIWAIRVAWFCILAGVGTCILIGISVLLSLRSQAMQYYSLLAGWHTLRLFCTLEVIAQSLLVFSLSFWIPAFFFEIYIIKLLVVFGVMALAAMGAVVMAIFKKVDGDFVIEGHKITPEMAPQLWYDLERLSAAMQTAPPDHVIAGIDDSFFVTQCPVKLKVKDSDELETYTGRTLFVSLSLLKKLPGDEADAVLLHELAHFNGDDTLYTQKISPLLAKYGHFLQGLHDGGISLPVFYFAVMFRMLFEVSLGSLSRQREFRADRLAASGTSPQSMAQALLRITAYSYYRNELEQEFFDADQAHQQVNLSQRIDGGFLEYATAFVDKRDAGELTTTHPFDFHPPLHARLEALGFSATPDVMRPALGDDSLGPWFLKIERADDLEREQWEHYEEQFRQFHENILAYRYIPSNAEEQELVEKFFPAVDAPANKNRTVYFDFEKLTFEDWDQPTYYREIESMTLENQWGARLDLVVKRDGKKRTIKLPLSGKQAEQQQAIHILEQYYARAMSAIAYQQSQEEPVNVAEPGETFSFD